MDHFNFRTADELLSAYYAERHEELPARQAYAWLHSYALRRGRVDDESFDYAEKLMDSSVFDVEDLAQNFLGLDLFINDLTPFDRDAGASVFGLASPETGTIKICERAVEYHPLFRSTVMHEVAHMVLHHGKRARTLCYAPRAAQRPPEEREADRFMASALLPKPLLFLAIVLAGRPFGLQEREALKAANTKRGRFQWRKFYFPFFLNRLQVSRELVAVQMSQQEKFDDATFKYHMTYAIPNRWRKPSPLTFASVIEGAIPPRQWELRKLDDCWRALVPEHLTDHCGLESFMYGTLAVTVDSSSHLFELKQLLLAGLKEELLRAAKSSGLRKITLRRRNAYDNY